MCAGPRVGAGGPNWLSRLAPEVETSLISPPAVVIERVKLFLVTGPKPQPPAPSCSLSTFPENGPLWPVLPTTADSALPLPTRSPRRAQLFASAHGRRRSRSSTTCSSAER